MKKRLWLSRKSEKGMTLVEVLAAVVILSIASACTLLIYSQSRSTSIQDNERLKATFLAQTVLEEWTALPANNYAMLDAALKADPNHAIERSTNNDNSLSSIWSNLNAAGYSPVAGFQYLINGNNGSGAVPVEVTVTVTSSNRITVSLHNLILPSSP